MGISYTLVNIANQKAVDADCVVLGLDSRLSRPYYRPLYDLCNSHQTMFGGWPRKAQPFCGL